MKYLKLSIFWIFALILASCGPNISGPPVDLAASSTFRGQVPLHVGEARILTYSDNGNTLFQLSDLEGVSCVATHQTYEVHFTAPAVLAVPTYPSGNLPPTVTCTHNGQTQSRITSCVRYEGQRFCDYLDRTFIFPL